MAQTATAIINKPSWVELSTPDVEAARSFYARIFGWQIDVSPDPQYGGYAIAKIEADDAAGIGPKQSADAPTASWACTSAPRTSTSLAQTNVGEAGGTAYCPAWFPTSASRAGWRCSPIPAAPSFPRWRARISGFAVNRSNAFGRAE